MLHVLTDTDMADTVQDTTELDTDMEDTSSESARLRPSQRLMLPSSMAHTDMVDTHMLHWLMLTTHTGMLPVLHPTNPSPPPSPSPPSARSTSVRLSHLLMPMPALLTVTLLWLTLTAQASLPTPAMLPHTSTKAPRDSIPSTDHTDTTDTDTTKFFAGHF